MHILITRPHDEAVATKTRLEALGLQTTLAPVLEITFEDITKIDTNDLQAIAVTSRNGIKSLHHNQTITDYNHLTCYAVGHATADLARSLGFRTVRQGPGTAKALAEMMVQELDPSAGGIAHFAGNHVAFDLNAAVREQGFKERRVLAYRATPARTLPDTAIAALKSGTVNGVILMSPRSAATFASLIEQHNLAATMNGLHFFCLSSSVKDALQTALEKQGDQCFSIPEHPNTEELLALITRFAANYDLTP